MAQPLTLKQEQFLLKLIDFIAEHGHAPTIREQQDLGGFRSSRTAAQYLDALEAAKYIARGGRRGLKILRDPRDTPPPRKARGAGSDRSTNPARPRRASMADATDLDGWANRLEAQSMLPQLVRQLIFATSDRSGAATFPAGEGVGKPGWDGITDFPHRSRFVPSGPAGWELGTSIDVESKAQSDYRTRTADPCGLVPPQTTFVFVTPRRSRDKDAWIARRRKDGIWKDVRAYDADDLEAWLELAPGVHAWFSRAIGRTADGVVDLATFARDWMEATQPPVTPGFLLAGRDDARKRVKDWLAGAPGSLALRAETREEAIAFFAAVVAELPEEERYRYEACAVIARTDAAWDRLALSRDPLILLPLVPPPSVVGAERNGHRVVLPLSAADVSSRPAPSIGPIDRTLVETELQRLEIGDREAQSLAHLARRSMMAFRRNRGIAPELHQPVWAGPAYGVLLACVMIIGAWDETRDADRDIVSRIAGLPYEQLVRDLARWAAEADAPVRHIGSKWFIVSKEDSWPLLARYLGRDDLHRFRDAAIEVLTTPDPRFELDHEKQWMATIYGKVRPHSGTLIEALADTLALMGARGNETRAQAGESAEAIASGVVWRVLDRANADHQLWASLSHVLPLLAEAAPDHFLDAVERGLTGPSPILRHMFADAPGTSSIASSPHTGLLWALERLAWSDAYLSRASHALARLALLDEPRGTLGNRPDISLRLLFVGWNPQTHASLAKRIEVIDRLRTTVPAIAWRLMISLLPQQHDVVFPHQAAVWREWGVEPPKTTQGEYFRCVRQVIPRILADVDAVAGRWTDVIDHLEQLSREDAVTAIDRLEAMGPEPFDSMARDEIRNALRTVISWRRSHTDGRWELTPADIDRLDAIHAAFAPTSLADQHRWLFTASPALLEGREFDVEDYEALVTGHRVEAVTALYDSDGLEAVLGFARTVEQPYAVGAALAGSTRISEEDIIALARTHLASEETAVDMFGRGLVGEIARTHGAAWLRESAADTAHWSPRQRARLLTFLDRQEEPTWSAIERADEETQAWFWKWMWPWGVPDDRLEYELRALLRHGRAYTAADLLAGRVHLKKAAAATLIADTLEAVLAKAGPTDNDPTPQNFGYDLGRLVMHLATNPSDVPLSRIAAIEWQLVPVLSPHLLEPRILHRELSRDPAFFLQVMSIVFCGENEEPPTDVSEQDRTRAGAAYRLLESWRVLPGTRDDGTIDGGALAAWVEQARMLAAKCDRTTITDLHIGEILGASPMGADGLWPHEAVRDVIEQVANPEIERGIALRVYNRRGVVSKSLREGGAQERELVARYTAYADAMQDRWSRTATMLRGRIAAFYVEDAARSDTEVELREQLE